MCSLLLENTEKLEGTITALEKSEDVVIVKVRETADNTDLNNALREAFLDKGLAFQKYWLWEQDQENTLQNGRQIRIYRQEKLHYSLLVEYLHTDGDFLAAAMIIPNVQETISLVNKVTITIFILAIIILILCIFLQVRKITIPLSKIGDTAKAIANREFRQLDIKTGDELELLAKDINRMSRKLQESQLELIEKNRQMEALLANVSHDLKTPVTLIKAYTSGIKDGMDDGTFLDTVIGQNDRMEKMIERLLDLSRTKQKQVDFPEQIELSLLVEGLLADYRETGPTNSVVFISDISNGLTIYANREAVLSILTNLISNSISYAGKSDILVSLHAHGNHCRFLTANALSPGSLVDISRVWEPFYVGEVSRNKRFSGILFPGGKTFFQHSAERMIYGQMEFLYIRGHIRRNCYTDIAQLL